MLPVGGLRQGRGDLGHISSFLFRWRISTQACGYLDRRMYRAVGEEYAIENCLLLPAHGVVFVAGAGAGGKGNVAATCRGGRRWRSSFTHNYLHRSRSNHSDIHGRRFFGHFARVHAHSRDPTCMIRPSYATSSGVLTAASQYRTLVHEHRLSNTHSRALNSLTHYGEFLRTRGTISKIVIFRPQVLRTRLRVNDPPKSRSGGSSSRSGDLTVEMNHTSTSSATLN